MKRLLLLCGALALTGCTCKRGGSIDSGAAPEENRGDTISPSEAWLQGRLPADVGAPKNGGTFVIRIPNEPAGLTRIHDQMADAAMTRYMGATVYECLGAIDRAKPEGPLAPQLAESWVESADHLTLTVHLRHGVTFHDGTAFTSKDVKALIDAILDVKNATASMRSYFTDLDGLTTPDPHTVVLKWKRPYFLANRTFLSQVPIMPSGALGPDFNAAPIHRAPIGTGPFKFEKWQPGASLSFVRNEQYWGPRPHLDRVVVRFVRDETVAAQLWERGEFDLMTRIPPTVWRGLEAAVPANQWAFVGYNRVAYYDNNYGWVGWNEKRAFFADPKVRRAMAMLYPAQTVSRAVDMGLEPPTTCPYYQLTESCDSSVEPIAYDPAKAKRLLDEAGWADTNGDGVRDKEGVPFKFTFLSTPFSVKQGKLLPILQEELHSVGIEMDIERVDASVYVSRLRAHDFDAATMSWSSADVLVDAYQIFHSSQSNGGSNYVSYASPVVDGLLDQIRTEFEPSARAALEKKVHRQLFDDQVYLFLTVRPQLDAAKKDVRGLLPGIAWYDLSKVWLAR